MYKHVSRCSQNSKNWENLSYHMFQDMLIISRKSKTNYECLSLLRIMGVGKRKTCQFTAKERKKIS